MNVEQDILAAEARRCAAIVHANAAELLECLDEEMIYVHSNAVVDNRDSYIASLVSGERKYLGFSIGTHTFRHLGDTVACLVEMEVQSLNGPVAVLATTVYRKRNNGPWKMVLWHSCSRKSLQTLPASGLESTTKESR
jgi:Domain of unknown function (DUF4440)